MNPWCSGFFFMCFAALLSHICYPCDERHITVVIASYNNSVWYEKNLESIFSQKYSNFNVVYVDDNSRDGTADLVEAYVRNKGYADKVTLIRNQKNIGSAANFYKAIHFYCKDDDIVTIVDGDDWFCNDYALSIINRTYDDSQVWLTYGSYLDLTFYSTRYDVPCYDVDSDEFRVNKRLPYFAAGFIPGHPLTCYAWLYKQIPLRRFLYGGVFARVASDVIRCYSLFDMAVNHFRYIPKVIYCHNVLSPISEAGTYFLEQMSVAANAKNMVPLSSLKRPMVTDAENLKGKASLVVFNVGNTPIARLIENVQCFVPTIDVLLCVEKNTITVCSIADIQQLTEKNNLSEIVACIKKYAGDYVICCTDDIKFTEKVVIENCIKHLEEIYAYSYCLLAYTNHSELLRFQKVFTALNYVNVYQFGYAVGDLAVPANTLMSLYRKNDFIAQIVNSDFGNVNTCVTSFGSGLSVDLKYEVGLF